MVVEFLRALVTFQSCELVEGVCDTEKTWLVVARVKVSGCKGQ